jgi:hypothetical protein
VIDGVAVVGGDGACDDKSYCTLPSQAEHRVDYILRSLLGSSP